METAQLSRPRSCFFLFVSRAFATETNPSITEERGPGLHLVESGQHGVVLELVTPTFRQESDGASCDLITVSGYSETDAAGWPRLPIKGAMVGIPAEAEVTLTVLETERATVEGSFELCPVASPIFDVELSGEINYSGEEAVQDPVAYSTDQFYPAFPAEVTSTGFVRSQRVAQLSFHPFQYNPVSGELEHYRRIRVQLNFVFEGRQALSEGAELDEGSFEDLLHGSLINYDSAREWRTQPLSSQALLDGPAGPRYKILLDADGIYQLSYDQLQAAGVAVDSLDPHTFQMHNQGKEIAIYVVGEEDGVFDTGDTILFYGQGMNTKYTNTNVYWLTWGVANGRRTPVLDGTPGGTAAVPSYFQTTRHVEENHNYQSARPSGPDADRWYWDYISASGSPVSKEYTFELQHLATAPRTFSLSTGLK